ncbi:MAG: hypothetical protein H2057_06575 [Alphaproteobacteria bacterium]|nr:hypothetical protein [Alphaproteobacteria bacterium]
MSHQNRKLSVLAALLLGSSVIAVEVDAKNAAVRTVQTRSFSEEYTSQKQTRRASPLKMLQLKAIDSKLYSNLFESHEILSRALLAKTFEINQYTSHSTPSPIRFEASNGSNLSGQEIAELKKLKELSDLASKKTQKDFPEPKASLVNVDPVHEELDSNAVSEDLPTDVSDKENTSPTVVKPVGPVTPETKVEDQTPSTKVVPTIVRAPRVSEKEEISSQPETHLTTVKDSTPEQELIPVKKEVAHGQAIVPGLEITPDFDLAQQNLLDLDVHKSVKPTPKAPPAPPAPPAGRLLNKGRNAGNPNLLKDLQNKNLKKTEDHKPQGAQGSLQNELLKELMGARKPRSGARGAVAQDEVNTDPESVGFRFNLRKVSTQDKNRFAKRLNGEVFEDENVSAGQNPFGQLGPNRNNGDHVDPQAAIREAVFKRPQLRKVAEEDKNKFKRDLQENPQDHADLVVGVMVGDSATINKAGLINHARANQKVLQDVKYQRPQLRKVNPDEQNKFAKDVAEKKAANAGQTLAENITAVQRNDGGSAAVKDRASHALKAVNVFADLKGGFDLKSLLRPTFARPKDMGDDVPPQQSSSQASEEPQNNSVDPSHVSGPVTPPTNPGNDALVQDPLQSSVNMGDNDAPSQSSGDDALIQDLLKSTVNVGGSVAPSQGPGDHISQGLPKASTIPTPPKMAPPKMLMGSRPTPSAPKQKTNKKSFVLVSLSADIGNEDNKNRMTHHNTSADVMDAITSGNHMARLRKTNTVASKEAQEMILREQENALNQQAAMRKIELELQARRERERLEEERKAEEARQVQARVAQQQKLAIENAKSAPGMSGLLQMIQLGQRDDGSAAGFGLKKVVKKEALSDKSETKEQLREKVHNLANSASVNQEDYIKVNMALRRTAMTDESDDEDDGFWD